MNTPSTDTDPFSKIAGSYDASFTNLPSVGRMRDRVHGFVQRFFPPRGCVLDLACGTGPDTMLLAEGGYQVVGADRSPAMLAEAEAKSCALVPRPLFVQMDAVSLSMFRDSTFDAILANFGGLNCVPDLRATLLECHRVLRPNGTIVLCLLGAYPAWESLAFALRGDWAGARRRRKGPVEVRVGRQTVTTRYYSIRALHRIVEGFFDVLATAGLNTVAPPPASQSFMHQYPHLTFLLYLFDRWMQSVPLVRALGDHTVFVLRRRSTL